jgi:hypothetical protein
MDLGIGNLELVLLLFYGIGCFMEFGIGNLEFGLFDGVILEALRLL